MSGAFVAIVIVLIVVGGATIGTVSFFRLQQHRADAVAMAEYRRLAEQAVAKQELLDNKLAELTDRITAVEKLLRSVG